VNPELARLADDCKYVLITTYRKSGVAVPTPVWAARDGDELVAWSVSTAGKIKRIRNSGKVTVAECDFRGNAKSEPLEATARLMDEDGSERARRAIARKYGVLGQITMFGSRLRRGRTGTIGIAISTT
jgi:hypothetical protein